MSGGGGQPQRPANSLDSKIVQVPIFLIKMQKFQCMRIQFFTLFNWVDMTSMSNHFTHSSKHRDDKVGVMFLLSLGQSKLYDFRYTQYATK